MKFLTGKQEKCDSDLPNVTVKFKLFDVPIEAGQRFKHVNMSPYHRPKWTVVDFEADSAIQGIYTDKLTACGAVALVKKNTKGHVVRVALAHLAGGIDEDIKRLRVPAAFNQEHGIEMVIQLGFFDDEKDVNGLYERYYLKRKKLIKAFPEIIEKRWPVHFLGEKNAHKPSTKPGTFVITRDGVVGGIVCEDFKLKRINMYEDDAVTQPLLY